MIIRHNTIGSSAYTPNALKNVPSNRVATVLFRSLNKQGQVENFKGNPKDTFKKMYKKFPAGFAIGLWRDSHDFKRGDDSFVVDKAKELQKLYTGKPIYYMPFLEDRLPASHKEVTFAKIRAVAPDLDLVNNPITGGEYIQGMLNELHYSTKPKGTKPPQHLMIYCFDGFNAFDSNFTKWLKLAEGAHMFSIWLAVYNCRLNTNDETSRPNRKSYPMPEHYQQGEYMLAHPQGKTNFKKPQLYKSNADRHKPGNQDLRADTPVFILKMNKKELLVLDKNSKKVFSAQNVGEDRDNPGFFIYRPSTLKWPHQWSKQAVKASGSSVCTVVVAGKNIGAIDLCYRDGYYYKDV